MCKCIACKGADFFLQAEFILIIFWLGNCLKRFLDQPQLYIYRLANVNMQTPEKVNMVNIILAKHEHVSIIIVGKSAYQRDQVAHKRSSLSTRPVNSTTF